MRSSLLEAKDPLQIPKRTRRPHHGSVEHFLFDHRVAICYPLFKRKFYSAEQCAEKRIELFKACELYSPPTTRRSLRRDVMDDSRCKALVL